MTGVDWIIVGLLLLLALFGWAQGFVTGALALAGFALGAWLGTRLAGALLPDGSRSPYAPAIGLVGALCVGAGFAAGFEGLGYRLRSKLTLPGLSLVDGALGALLTALVGLGVVWIVGAVAVHSAGDIRYEVQRSQILSRLNEALPPVGPAAQRARALRPVPAHRRPRGARGRRPRPASPAIPTSRRPGTAWSRCSARPAASASRARAGSRAMASWSPTPTSSPARTTRGCCCAAASPGWTPPPSPSTPRTTSPSCA